MSVRAGREPLAAISESELIKRDSLFQLQRIRTQEGRRMLVKFAVADLGGAEARLLEHEFQVFQRLGGPHTLQPVGLDGADGLRAVYEDFDGAPLSWQMASQMADGSGGGAAFVRLVEELCAALGHFHDGGWVLGGMTPHSFLRDAGGRVVVTDAPFAHGLQSAFALPRAYLLTNGYLAYVAPEVLGRGALDVDARSDLYSLGAVLYHMLCGQPPFETSDPAELIQCHLAKEPRSLAERRQPLPRSAADLVMRLLAKNPVDRFESAKVFADHLRREMASAGGGALRAGEPVPGSEPAMAPRLSAKLYGLDSAIANLNEKVRRTRSAAAIAFVEGEAGVGKTSLLAHVRTLLAHGYFCRGSFPSGSPAPPLSGWGSALRDLASILLTKSAADLDRWRRKIIAELGDRAALLGNLVPEWAALLGTTARASDEILDGALNRLAVTIHLLLRCYAELDKPVVLVLDDLQWADRSSLEILELVVSLAEPINLLVLCGVRRSSTLDPYPPDLAALRQALESSRGEVDSLRLGPWGKQEVDAFLRDSFGCAVDEVDALSAFVLARTHGNPLFVHEFLRTAIQQRLFTLDRLRGTWSYRPEALHTLAPADSVIEFLIQKMLALSEELSETVRTAACLGPRFRLSDFAAAAEVSREVAVERLTPALVEGFVLVRPAEGPAASSDGARVPDTQYEFAHDRVLEASLRTVSEERRAACSLEIGKKLLAAHAGEVPAEAAHRLAAYFNAARHLVVDEDERRRLARLNLRGGGFAKQSGAFSQALDHFRAGLHFLGTSPADGTPASCEGAWSEEPELARALFEAAAEAALLNGELAPAHELCDALLAHSSTPLQRARPYEVRIAAFNAAKRFQEAVTAAREILVALGVRFPQHPWLAHTVVAYLTTKRRIFSGPVDRLTDLRRNEDPEVKAAFRIMQAMYSSAYFGDAALFPLLVCRHINASLEYGNEDYSCVTYIAFAIVLCARRNFEAAAALGRVALELLKRPGAETHTAKVFLGQYAFVLPWMQHLRDTIPFLMEGSRAGLQNGDFEYAAHLLTTHSLARLHCGYPLAELLPEFEQQRVRLSSLRHERSIILLQLFCQLLHDLRETPADVPPLHGPHYVEEETLPRCLNPLDENLAFHHFMAKMMVCHLRGDRARALEAAGRAREFFEGGAFGFHLGAVFTFWESLLWAWAAREGGSGSKAAFRKAARGSKALRAWAASAPMNFLHKHHLIEAELCRARGCNEEAAANYERAIELAQAHEYLQDAAIAHECAAEFYLARGMKGLARHCLRESYTAYRRWGATAATRRLARKYPQYFAVFASDDPETPSSLRLSDSLDYRALLRSSQAISGEVQLPNLLGRLLRTMFQHAGAQRAVLALERRGELFVVAEADVDHDGVQFVVEAGVEERVEESVRLCRSIARYVATTAKPVVVADAIDDQRFNKDSYVHERRPRSVLCIPMIHQGKLLGVAYLENNRVSHLFTASQLEIASLLAGQAAISIAGARLHALELQAQQAKINPHFLFNALSSIADLAVEDGRRAEDAIVKLAHLYRYILATTQETPVTLGQELEVVKHYLALEKLRFGSKLDFSVTCDEDVKLVRIPGLLVQPLVENSIRHGISPKMSGGTVWVHASTVADRCRIVVQDDGDGASPGTSGTGFGLRSVQERLGLVFGRDYSIAITRRGGYRVELQVPLRRTDSADLPVAGEV